MEGALGWCTVQGEEETATTIRQWWALSRRESLFYSGKNSQLFSKSVKRPRLTERWARDLGKAAVPGGDGAYRWPTLSRPMTLQNNKGSVDRFWLLAEYLDAAGAS